MVHCNVCRHCFVCHWHGASLHAVVYRCWLPVFRAIAPNPSSDYPIKVPPNSAVRGQFRRIRAATRAPLSGARIASNRVTGSDATASFELLVPSPLPLYAPRLFCKLHDRHTKKEFTNCTRFSHSRSRSFANGTMLSEPCLQSPMIQRRYNLGKAKLKSKTANIGEGLRCLTH
jgi:hypothetical protein